MRREPIGSSRASPTTDVATSIEHRIARSSGGSGGGPANGELRSTAIDRDCLESTPVHAAVETLTGALTLAPAGSVSSDAEAQIDCRFEGPKSCVEPQYQQFGCPRGVEPCTWSTDAGISLDNASQWMPGDAGVQIVSDEQPEPAMTFCADGDVAELRVEPLLDERDGMRLRFERLPG